MDYLTRASLTASTDLAYRSRSLAGAIADLAASIDEMTGKDVVIDRKCLGQIIHLAEIAGDYCGEVGERLEMILLKEARGQRDAA